MHAPSEHKQRRSYLYRQLTCTF